jgi:hypothetical protein
MAIAVPGEWVCIPEFQIWSLYPVSVLCLWFLST